MNRRNFLSRLGIGTAATAATMVPTVAEPVVVEKVVEVEKPTDPNACPHCGGEMVVEDYVSRNVRLRNVRMCKTCRVLPNAENVARLVRAAEHARRQW